ncbi:MAG: hypothetical protein ACRCUS_06610 [Anaerovoracaceae bacterium]
MRKIIVMVLSLALVIVSMMTAPMAFGNTEAVEKNELSIPSSEENIRLNLKKNNEDIEEDIAEDFIGDLADMGFEIEKIKENKDGEVIVTAEIESLETVVAIKSADDKEVAIVANDNGKSNEIILNSEGKIEIDGSKIFTTTIIDNDNSDTLMKRTEKDLVANLSYSYCTKTCPYGKASDYTNFGYRQKSNLTLDIAIEKLTNFAILSAFTAGFGSYIAGGAKLVTIVKYVAAGVGIYGAASIQKSRYLSVDRSVYYHKVKGYKINGALKVENRHNNYYFVKNQSGPSVFEEDYYGWKM